MNHNARGYFNLHECCDYVYDAAYYLQSNDLSGKIKIKKPMMVIVGDLPVLFMGYELLWV